MQKKQTILVVASLLVVVLSVTLAYFTAQIIGKGKDVSVSSADLKIIFTDILYKNLKNIPQLKYFF